MKIAEVESLVVGGGQFVRITTDSGLVGTGQTACWGYPSAVDQVVQTFKRYLIGQDPLLIERHWRAMFATRHTTVGGDFMFALSRVDIALWDLLGGAAAHQQVQADLVAAATAEQLPDRRLEVLRLDVPEGDVHG